MLLQDRLEHVGDRLFRYRGVIPLLALLEIPVAIARAHPGRLSGDAPAWLGLGLALGGLALRTLVIGFVPRGTSGRISRGQKARTLNTTGAYSIVRNPLYVGNFFCWTGVTLLLRDPLLIAFNTVAFLVFYLLIILREEEFLEETFGDAYRAFAERVPCLIPDPRLWRAPDLDFSVRTTLRREHDTVFGTLGTLVGLQIVWHTVVQGTDALAPFWPALLAGTFGFWLVVKTTKRFTHLLDVSRTAHPASDVPTAPPAEP